MKSPFSFLAARLGVAAGCLFFCAGLISAQSLPGYRAPDKAQPKQESLQTKAARGQAPLRKLFDYLRPDPAKARRLPKLSPSEKAGKAKNKAQQIGAVRSLPEPIKHTSDGTAYRLPDGDVHVMSIVSTGALYTRVQFTEMNLPVGARVFVYSIANTDEFYGPYEGHGPSEDGTFWTPPMKGDGVVIEYFAPASVASGTRFKVSKISHVYKNASSLKVGGCHNDVSDPWTETAKSVGRLDFVSGGGVFICTGTLLADSVPSSDIPYVLTAGHCFATQTEAQSLRVWWNYNTGDDPPGGTSFTDGATLLATGTASDFTFVRLTGTVPGGLFFSGWEASTFAGTSSSAGVHHPDGSHKRISFGTSRQPTGGECPAGLQCLTVDWTSGVTEPGSSGSGIWTGLPTDPGGAKLIGTLTGGPSSCGAPTASLKDFYGRFSVTYPLISSFLEGTYCDTSLSPTNQNFSNAAGGGSFTVNAPGGCNWTAATGDSWITITTPASGTGNGTVNFTVAANGGTQRSGSIIVGGQVFIVTQSGGGACAPTPISIGQTINGTLSISDCPLSDGSFYDVYSFTVSAGTPVSVFMQSTAFDTYLFLNNPNGTNLTQDDDGGGGTNSRIPPGSGFITLTTAGTYTIWANSFSANETGPYALTLNGSAPPTPKTLTVASQNPNSGVNITVSPNDNNGNSNGTTQFARTYNHNVTATLTAPGTAGGNIFQEWRKDGASWSSSTNTLVTMDADHTMTAVYRPLNDFVLTVGSSNPNSGVGITITPNDNNGLGNGVTQFTRTYKENTTIEITAPLVAPNGHLFQKWQLDGQDFAINGFHVTMIRNITVVAFYVPPATYTLTVTSSNPNSGIDIQMSPNDQNGLSNGTTQYTRSYLQNTVVNFTAPATAPNGKVFDRWVANGSHLSFGRTAGITMTSNITLTANYLTKPTIYAETGTNEAAALDSVTFTRGPFSLLNQNNFSSDARRRIVLFTSDLGLTQSDVINPSVLRVYGSGFEFPIESVGPLTTPSLAGSYIIIRLPDGLPAGPVSMRVQLRFVDSDLRTLTFAP